MMQNNTALDNIFMAGLAGEYTRNSQKIITALEHLDTAAKLIIDGEFEESSEVLELRELAIRDMEDLCNTVILLQRAMAKSCLENMKCNSLDEESGVDLAKSYGWHDSESIPNMEIPHNEGEEEFDPADLPFNDLDMGDEEYSKDEDWYKDKEDYELECSFEHDFGEETSD